MVAGLCLAGLCSLPPRQTLDAHLKYAAVQVGVDMLLCAVAVALTMAKLEFRRYQDIQPQEAAEFARMLEMYLYSSKNPRAKSEEGFEAGSGILRRHWCLAEVCLQSRM